VALKYDRLQVNSYNIPGYAYKTTFAKVCRLCLILMQIRASSACRWGAHLSSSTSLSLSHVVQSSFGSPPFSAQHTAAPNMPPADFTRFANWTAFCSSLKKLSTTRDTPWSSTWGSKQQFLRLGPCNDRVVVACHCSARVAAGCPFKPRVPFQAKVRYKHDMKATGKGTCKRMEPAYTTARSLMMLHNQTLSDSCM